MIHARIILYPRETNVKNSYSNQLLIKGQCLSELIFERKIPADVLGRHVPQMPKRITNGEETHPHADERDPIDFHGASGYACED